MDRLTAMRVFVTVVDEGGFTAAARKLRLSKSAVSTLMRDLEGKLGTALLNRTTRRMSLTEAGVRFKTRAEQILADVEEAEREATALTHRPRGLLRVSAGVSFGIRHLGRALLDFARLYPDVTVDLSLTDRFIDLVDEGVDVAIRIGHLTDSTLIARRLSYTHRIVCAASGYLEKHGRPERPEDLGQHNCLGYNLLATGDSWRFLVNGAETEIAVKGSFSTNNGDLLREAAAQGLGLYYAPTFIVHDDLRSGRLTPLLEAYVLPPLDIHAVFPASRFVSAKVRSFVDHLVGHFAGPPRWEIGLPFIVHK